MRKLSWFLPLMALLFITSLAGCDKEATIEAWVLIDGDFVLTEVSSLPEYIDGGNEGFGMAVGEAINYPADARENGIEGRVVLWYVVTDEGIVTDIEIVEDIGGGCGDAAAQALEEATPGVSFYPAEINGMAVTVRLELPVDFSLQ